METTVQHNIQELLTGHLLREDNIPGDDATEELIAGLRRDHIAKPVIFIGSGSCGIIAGAGKVKKAVENYLREREITADIIETGCMGICSNEPVMDIQLPGRTRLSFSKVDPEEVTPILDDVFHTALPPTEIAGQYAHSMQSHWQNVPLMQELPFLKIQQRNVLENCGIINPGSIEEYIARGGYKAYIRSIRYYTFEEVCNMVAESGLRGRAGAGFPTGEKWKIAFHTHSDQRYLICNAEESDPGAFMDRTIMEGDPHRLIEGMAIAAYAIGATKAYIYIRSEYELAIDRLTGALNDAKSFNLLGQNIFDSGYNLDIKLVKGPGAFICGEETALIRCLEGKRGRPRTKPPYPAVQGLFRKPTVINNVETLSNIPAILKNGPGWFRKTGTPGSSGTKIFSVSGDMVITGLIEVPMGTPLKSIIEAAGGWSAEDKPKAVFLGGPSGFCLPEQELDIPVDYDAFHDKKLSFGSGGIVVAGKQTCIPDLVKYFMTFMQAQSCGKCIPCREGTRRIKEIMESITRKPVDENGHTTLERFKGVMQLENLASVMKETSLCGLGQRAPNPLLSSLRWFREEYEEHIFDRTCKSGVCRELRTFSILVDQCTGCTVCAKKCPEEAIVGSASHPYFIIQEKCTGCGICLEVCKFNAIQIS